MIFRPYIITIGLILCSLSFKAQEKNYTFNHFNMDQGLIDHRVTSVLEHSEGYLWIGTMNGLSRFDGYEFVDLPLPKESFNTYGSVGPRIKKLTELKSRDILVEYYLNTNSKDSLFSIINLKDYSVQTKAYTEIPPPNEMIIYNEEQVDSLSIGERIHTYDRNKNYIKNIYDQDKNLKESILYIKDRDSINLIDAWYNTSMKLSYSGIDFSKSISAYSQNGLNIISPKNKKFKNFLRKEVPFWSYGNKIRAIHPLSQDSFLISIEKQGLHILDLKNNITTPFPVRLNSNNEEHLSSYIMRFVEDESGKLWALEYSNDLLRLDLDNKSYSNVLGGDNFLFHDLILLNNGKLLLSGIDEESKFFFYTFDTNKNQGNKINVELPSADFRPISGVLLQEDEERVWAGTNQGLFLYNIIDGEILKAYYHKSNPLNSNSTYPQFNVLDAHRVIDLLKISTDTLWVGTDQEGINIIDLKNDKSSAINQQNGLSDNRIAEIIDNSEGIWISTFNGLNYYSKEERRLTKFNAEDGLPHYEFNKFSSLKSQKGRLLLGTMNGLTTFQQDIFQQKQTSPELILAQANYFDNKDPQLKIKYANFDSTPVFQIPSSNRNCSFKFSMNSSTVDNSTTYKYKLVPIKQIDKSDEMDWEFNGTNREVKFNYLPAGKFILSVQGINLQGQLSNVKTIILDVKPFFYQTWWFILISILLATMFAYVLFRFRLNQALKIERIKTSLSSNLHDEVGSVLSGIAFQMEVLEDGLSDDKLPQVQQIAKSSRSAMSKMRDVVWAIDGQNNSLIDLKERIMDFASESIPSDRISTSVYLDQALESQVLKYEFRYDLLLIVKEFITNSIKHGEVSSIEIRINQEDKVLKIVLQDDGKGFDSQLKSTTGQGLKNMKARCLKHGGELKMSSESGVAISMLFTDVL